MPARYQLRKIIKNRGHFPGDDAVIKLLWLAIRDIEDKRARARASEKGAPRDTRKAPARLVEGAVVQGWKQALGALSLHYPDRLAPYLRQVGDLMGVPDPEITDPGQLPAAPAGAFREVAPSG